MQYSFDNFTLDLERLELRGADGPIAIEPKVFDVLALLIRRSHHVVSKDDILTEVWSGRIVSDASLSSAIKSARAALNDDGATQRYIKTVHGRGFRFVGQLKEPAQTPEPAAFTQDIRFCRVADGTRIAYGLSGDGPVVVKSSNWMSHLEFELDSPIWRPWIEALSTRARLLRYDERGNGLSDRAPKDVSFDTRLTDLETVVDAARISEPFVLLGISAGAALSAAFAARNPDKVRGLILLGGFARGWRAIGENSDMPDALTAMIRSGWGRETHAFRQLFTSLFFPQATAEESSWFNDLQRKTVAPDIAAKLWSATGDLDIAAVLPKLTMPALVIHALDDVLVPVRNGEDMAASLPDARFIALQTGNHLPLASEPAFARVFDTIDRFLADLP